MGMNKSAAVLAFPVLALSACAPIPEGTVPSELSPLNYFPLILGDGG